MKKTLHKAVTVLIIGHCLLTNFANAQLNTVLTFTSTNSSPMGSLISDGTNLYGMTSGGGANNQGTVFKVKPDGTSYINLLDFSGTNGTGPRGSLLSDGIYLYGTTSSGGANNNGTVFKIKTDGTSYTNLFDFNNTTSGINPYGSLISDGTWLYGTTSTGGVSNHGTIFKIKPDGTGFDTLLTFRGINGSTPEGSLISDGVYLYSMTKIGGANNQGTVFKIKPDGSNYSDLLDFSMNGLNGGHPTGSLISDGVYLYGLTSYGGVNGFGNIFKIKPDGSNFTVMMEFDGINGYFPYGSLLSDGNYLYGTTYNGGLGTFGNIFKIKPDGTGFSNMVDFNGTNGSYPHADLLLINGVFYGTAKEGGASDYGVVFSLCLAPPTISVNSATICAGSTATLTASGAATYVWNTGATNASITATPSVTTTYTVTGTNQPNCMSTDTVHVFVNACLGIAEIENNTRVTVYPNPSTGNFVVTTTESVDKVSVTDVLGNELLSVNSNGTTININLSAQPSGVYFIKVSSNGIQTTKRIIIHN
jgi:uncharacterized repeat protein (TIGR03803 family)